MCSGLVIRRNFSSAPTLCRDQSPQHHSLKFTPRGRTLSVLSLLGLPCSSGNLCCRSVALLCSTIGGGRGCAQLVLAAVTDVGKQASLR